MTLRVMTTRSAAAKTVRFLDMAVLSFSNRPPSGLGGMLIDLGLGISSMGRRTPENPPYKVSVRLGTSCKDEVSGIGSG